MKNPTTINLNAVQIAFPSATEAYEYISKVAPDGAISGTMIPEYALTAIKEAASRERLAILKQQSQAKERSAKGHRDPNTTAPSTRDKARRMGPALRRSIPGQTQRQILGQHHTQCPLQPTSRVIPDPTPGIPTTRRQEHIATRRLYQNP